MFIRKWGLGIDYDEPTKKQNIDNNITLPRVIKKLSIKKTKSSENLIKNVTFANRLKYK